MRHSTSSRVTVPAAAPVSPLRPTGDLRLARRLDSFRNPTRERLARYSLEQKEMRETSLGAYAVDTGRFTGRSPRDRYLVRHPESALSVNWGANNQPLFPRHFDELYELCIERLKGRPVFVCDLFVGQDPKHRRALRVVTEKAWHAYFCLNMFIEPSLDELLDFRPDFTILNASGVTNSRFEEMGLHSEVFAAFDVERCVGVIGGTEYGGEMKKGMFSVMNTLLPQADVLPMHCATNVDDSGQSALFFGLSGTGKTTLSAEPETALVGDDEHGWSSTGVFNLEGGCYAKTGGLDAAREPEIFSAIRRGALLENVALSAGGEVNFSDQSRTPNGRVSYSLEHIERVCGQGGTVAVPRVVFFLTCDASGVLPPISRLDRQQALVHFVLGYTSKVAGTECGIVEPEATFSPCFGGPFMTAHPLRYAQLLQQRLQESGADVYLVNTGWTGGGLKTGHRIALPTTRKMVAAARAGRLAFVRSESDSALALRPLARVPGVEGALLAPRKAWSSEDEYEQARARLSHRFSTALAEVVLGAPAELRDLGVELLDSLRTVG